MIEILILSIVQGVTEFLPVSSSSHLILLSKFTHFNNQGLSIDISLHIGSFFAVLTYFNKDIKNFIQNRVLFLKILLASVPAMLAGYYLAQNNMIEKLRNLQTIGWMTLIFGLLLFLSDKFKLKYEIKKDLNYKSAIIIGLFQVLSLVPGVSRSGITISAARLLNFKRFDAAKISFLMSIPILGAVSIFGLSNIILSGNMNFSLLNIISILFSYFFSLITIKYFLRYIKKFSLNLFVVYRIFLGIILLSYAY